MEPSCHEIDDFWLVFVQTGVKRMLVDIPEVWKHSITCFDSSNVGADDGS